MSGEAHFDHPERKGADNLKKAGYEEYEEFKESVLSQIEKTGTAKGYFCATCEYYLHKEGTLKGGYCKKLQAEDAPWGCCDLWDFEPKDLRKSTEPVKEQSMKLKDLLR